MEDEKSEGSNHSEKASEAIGTLSMVSKAINKFKPMAIARKQVLEKRKVSLNSVSSNVYSSDSDGDENDDSSFNDFKVNDDT